MATRAHLVRVGDRDYRLHVTEDGGIGIAGVNGTYHASQGPDGATCVIEAGSARRWQVFLSPSADGWQVFVGGEMYELRVVPDEGAARTEHRRAAGAQPEHLTVPMPARVVKVLVAPGQSVQRGQVVMTLEAMKMELPLRAPRDGTVRAVSCKEGDLVQPGTSVVEIA